MKKRSSRVFGIGTSLLLMLPVSAAAVAATKKPADAKPAPVEPALDPAAVAALEDMGRALRQLDHFTLRTISSVDVVLESGQKVQLDGQATYRVKRPDGLFVELESDRKLRRIYFDGKSLTVHAPRLRYYTTVPTRARTLSELTSNAEMEYGISLPLADLFYQGTDEFPTSVLTSALHIGPATVDGVKTEQYAFRQPGVDWQVWIGNDNRLPQKIVIANVEDPTVPEFRARLQWDTASAVPASEFRFDPPKDAASIVLTLPAADGGNE